MDKGGRQAHLIGHENKQVKFILKTKNKKIFSFYLPCDLDAIKPAILQA
jgi:hypothetical protein